MQEGERLKDYEVLRQARIIGSTTSACAKHAEVLESVQPGIIVVEEAAEILEAQVLACLHPLVRQLIMIGDHQQLQPAIEEHQLQRKNLHISMFERLIRRGVRSVCLTQQWRMHPEISQLVKFIYTSQSPPIELLDHPTASMRTLELSVTGLPRVSMPPGMVKRLFFWTHDEAEQVSATSRSKSNKHEVHRVLCECACFGDSCLYFSALLTGFTCRWL